MKHLFCLIFLFCLFYSCDEGDGEGIDLGGLIEAISKCDEQEIVAHEVSAFQDEPDKYHPGEHAYDGDLTTRWSAPYDGVNTFIKLYLEEETLVTGVNLAWYKSDSRTATYEVWTKKNNAASWEIVQERTESKINAVTEYERVELPLTSATFVLIRGFGNSGTENSEWVSLSDAAIISEPTNFRDWKITLPVCDESGSTDCSRAYEVFNPPFTNWMCFGAPEHLSGYLKKNSAGNWEFYCPYTGVTTPGSTYSRTELREMDYDSRGDYNWTLEEGGTMKGRFRIAKLEGGANKVIVMQIHGKVPVSKPLLKMVWDKGELRALLKVKDENGEFHDLPNDREHSLDMGEGEWATVKIVARRDKMEIWKDDVLMVEWGSEALAGWEDNTFYFKAGCYLLHNDNFSQAATVEYNHVNYTH